MSCQPRHVVTLVHGTFARNAAWIQPTSYFCTTLQNHFTSHDLIIEQFNWSGWNSPWSRRKAASRLREQLGDRIATYSQAQHYVIGHSHGGAVAVQAVYGSRLSERVSGVATLATPFIHTRRRGIGPFNYGEMLTWLTFVPLTGFITYGLFSLWMDLGERMTFLGKFNVPAFLAATLAAGSLLLVLARALGRFLLQLAEDTTNSLQCAVPDASNLLIVRTSGDEASALLASSQLLSSAITRIWYMAAMVLRPLFSLLNATERVAKILPALVIALCFGFLLCSWEGTFWTNFADAMAGKPINTDPFLVSLAKEFLQVFTDPDNRSVVLMILSLLILVILLAGTAFVAVTCFIVPAILLLSVALLPFGPESALAGLLVEISVESVPPGIWKLNQFGPLAGAGAGVKLLHSASYEDNRVLNLLALWITQGELASTHVKRTSVGTTDS